ncbi:MAG: hypothetical protein L0215_25810 [Gemmataceae bacterium]|nr:hypothetical protein [Gemmataceae bacterium]
MASIPVQQSTENLAGNKADVTPRAETLDERFRRLAGEWEHATLYLSSMEAASKHPAYQEIIAIGPEVVPLLLRDLETNHTHWFIALNQITGAQPVPKEASGNIRKMAQAWLNWAKDKGFSW